MHFIQLTLTDFVIVALLHANAAAAAVDAVLLFLFLRRLQMCNEWRISVYFVPTNHLVLVYA